MPNRDFASALSALRSTISVGDALTASAARRRDTVHDMQQYVSRCGLDAALRRMRFVHVAGSKGKGSTCVMVDSLLRKNRQLKAPKIGLYTSPHLVSVVERIRIDGMPISEADFANAFWSIWECLERADCSSQCSMPQFPGYFKFLTLVALRAWEDAHVEIGVVEVGMGGRFDATNVLPPASVIACGVNTLELEHTRVLGNTLRQIAWEKGGILRARSDWLGKCAWFTVPQDDEAMQSLKECAQEARGCLTIITPLSPTQSREFGLLGDEKAAGINAALAIALARAAASRFQRATTTFDIDCLCMIPPWNQIKEHVRSLTNHSEETMEVLPSLEEAKTLQSTTWPGRAHRFKSPDWQAVTFFIDGAHTDASMSACVRWFDRAWRDEAARESSAIGRKIPHRRVLLFSCGHEKNPVSLLRTLLAADRDRFDVAIFCLPNESRPSKEAPPTAAELLKHRVDEDTIASAASMVTDMINTENNSHGSLAFWPQTLAIVFAALLHQQCKDQAQAIGIHSILATSSVTDALAHLRTTSCQPTLALATGSLYLVGGVLEQLGWNPAAPAQPK
eukprot:TRINITY_DN31893_c0_g2_i1.p1 TRINITY_DN31893_c0_g2~~TRINITY_DN31893_c0_g2_i1.p1  ORF type:complete len:595 (-),score=90.85 TRINITY_DN31893_c0_g2_i1:42-1736(-)